MLAVKTAELIREVQESKTSGELEDEMETLAGARGAEFDGFVFTVFVCYNLVAHQEVIFVVPKEKD